MIAGSARNVVYFVYSVQSTIYFTVAICLYPIYLRTFFVDECCTIISININKYSNVNCTLKKYIKYPTFRALPVIKCAKVETWSIFYTVFKVHFTLLYLFISIGIMFVYIPFIYMRTTIKHNCFQTAVSTNSHC